ncbi:hypothetical protein Vadar_016078 [Vaccinium darrowii]|uniref:Uncharacterized protein n=1 Tax=Vaccinium darrowii TaxID=229202 RepID=A0ACB7YWV6_9ERIC|nr:hypothetical protein Vadar_016078 [Vaccinium darrowii]
MDKARDSASHTRKASGGEPGPDGSACWRGIGGAKVGFGVVVLQEARGGPGTDSVPDSPDSGRKATISVGTIPDILANLTRLILKELGNSPSNQSSP